MTSNSVRSGCLAAILVSLGLMTGCASSEPTLDSKANAASATAEACTQWLGTLDEAIDRAGVREAGPTRIAGFPYLRVDRFLASFAPAVTDRPSLFADWIAGLRDLDHTARTVELRNLGDAGMQSLGVRDATEAAQRTDTCAGLLQRHDLATPEQRRQLADHAQVPDDYHTVNRVLGLYPLTSIPFAHGIESWHQEAAAQFIQASTVTPASATSGDPLAHRFEPAGRPASARDIAALFARTPPDALGIPHFTASDRALLLQTFAPVFDIGTTGPDDRFGPLVWRGGPAPEVDSQRPAAYQRLALTRYHDRVLVQLVYTVWFPQRPRDKWLDMLSGQLDGVVFRVTLDAQGRPLIYDSIHPCGCYHMFFPTALAALKPAPDGEAEWAFVPASAPTLTPPQRITIRTESRTHYVIGIGSSDGRQGTPYRLIEDQDLRTLPTPDGGTRSVFGPDGLVPGTERGERLVFWPMGISSAGAMREWGHHATAFTGERHFDDPDLFERRFSIPSML